MPHTSSNILWHTGWQKFVSFHQELIFWQWSGRSKYVTPPQLWSIGSSFFLFECAIVLARRLFSYIRVNCCWISWAPIYLIVINFLSKTCGNCVTISYPRQREKYLAGALAMLSGKFWLVQKYLGCITYFS